MSKFETAKGVMKTFFWLAKEELDSMDHKLFRIALGIIAFIVSSLLWYFLFNLASPF
jgi:hypothetical protein